MADPDTKRLLQRTARDSIIYLPAMIIPAVVGIIMLRVFTTIFTREQFGYYNNALSTTGLIKTFSVIWLSSSAVRFYQNFNNEDRGKEYFSTLLLATTLSAVVCAGLAWAILLFIRSQLAVELFTTLQAAIISTVFVAFFEIFVVVFRVSMQPSKYSLYWVLYVVAKPILGLILIKTFSLGVEGLFWSWCLTPFFLTFFIFKDIKVKNFSFRSTSAPALRAMASYGVPLAVSNFAVWILSLSDRYLIEIFRTSDEVGLYGLGFAIPEKTLQFAYMTLMLAAYPIIIENFETGDQESTERLITEMSRFYILLMTPVMLALVCMPEQLVLVFAERKFSSGAVVTPLISIGLYLYGLAMYVQKGLELKRKSKRIALIAFLAGAIAIGLNLLLIPRLGYMGAGVSFLISYSSYFIFSCLYVKKVMPWRPPKRTIINTSIAALAMIAAMKIVAASVVSGILQISMGLVSSTAIYIVILFLMREIKKDDFMMLTGIFKKVAK